MCTVLLPSAVNPVAVNKYIKSYQHARQDRQWSKAVDHNSVLFHYVTLSAPRFGLTMEGSDLTKNAMLGSQRHTATSTVI